MNDALNFAFFFSTPLLMMISGEAGKVSEVILFSLLMSDDVMLKNVG